MPEAYHVTWMSGRDMKVLHFSRECVPSQYNLGHRNLPRKQGKLEEKALHASISYHSIYRASAFLAPCIRNIVTCIQVSVINNFLE